MAKRTGTRDEAARPRFAGKQWDGLEPMLEDYTREAVAIAREDFREELALGVAPAKTLVDRLDRILNRLSPAPEPLAAGDGDWLTLLWGSWFGELLRREFGGTWTMTTYPGSQFAVPTLEVNESRLYPTMKVHRRLSLGAGEELPAFYSMLRSRLEQAPN